MKSTIIVFAIYIAVFLFSYTVNANPDNIKKENKSYTFYNNVYGIIIIISSSNYNNALEEAYKYSPEDSYITFLKSN